ncbi:MAG TPA: HD domain-containing phosphohydrolase [Pirellulales bacterium]|nr:HD domain-containing phosphohydrolase [Pirellulales bacterium]
MNSSEYRLEPSQPGGSRAAGYLVDEQLASIARRTDRMFAWLMGLEWIATVAAAQWFSPRGALGTFRPLSSNVEAAAVLGGVLACLPIYLAVVHPGRALTRHVIAIAQLLWPALLVHLIGGRIDPRLHVLGSLAALACYRRWRVLVTATVVVALDHLARNLGWPQAAQGIAATGSWSALEHAGWVFFEDVFLWLSMRHSLVDMRRRAVSEGLVVQKTDELEKVCDRMRAKNRELMISNQELVESEARRRRAHEETIHWLVKVSLYRDEETGAHIQRTGWYSELLAATAGWPRELVDQIRLAAPMHDLGKIGIPDAILRKPGKLTREEMAVMQTHTLLGAKMLAGATTPVLCMAREIAMCHHERWDGGGYPAGLAGPEIPETARIVAIVDFFDALSHDRCYRPAFPDADVERMLREGRGTHFDPRLLDIFLSLLPEMRAISLAVPDDAEEKEVPAPSGTSQATRLPPALASAGASGRKVGSL